MFVRVLAAAGLLNMGLGAAQAHVTLEMREAPADSYYKAAFNVGHGCHGSPTVRIRVRIPDSVVAVKPQPKAGWTLTITQGKLATAQSDGHGGTTHEGVTEVSWSGGIYSECGSRRLRRPLIASSLSDLPFTESTYFTSIRLMISCTVLKRPGLKK